VCAGGNGLGCLATSSLMARIMWLSLMTTTRIASCNYCQATTIASVSPFRLNFMQGQNSCCDHRTKLNFSECEQSMHMHHDVYMLVPLLSLLRLLPLPDVALTSPTVPNEFVPDTLRCGTYGFVTRSADWSYSTALFCLFRRDLCTYRSL